MPYIKKPRRIQLEPVLKMMYDLNVDSKGDINYLLYAYFKRYFDMSYNEVKNYCGELVECAAEIRRRLTGPYEDKKIEENGDIL